MWTGSGVGGPTAGPAGQRLMGRARPDVKAPAGKPTAPLQATGPGPLKGRPGAFAQPSTRSIPAAPPRAGQPGRAQQGHEGEVAEFLRALGLEQYTERVLRNGFDEMDTLMHADDGDLRELGLLPCHVVKLRRKLQELLRQAGEGPEFDENNQVAAFLREVGLGCYAEVLLRNGFDELEILLDIEDADMKEMGIPRGHAVKLRRRLQERLSGEAPAPTHQHGGYPGSAQQRCAAAASMPSDAMKTAVERSWEQVQALGTYTVAELLYRHTFELQPDLVDLFPPDVVHKYRDWTADEAGLDGGIHDSPALRKLFSKYMNAVGCTVAGLHDFSKLVPMLRTLGSRHIGYGVKEEHWPILGKALIITLREVLGASFTPEVESAWTMVYGFMSNIMIEGLRSAIAARDMSDTISHEQMSPPLSEKALSIAGLGGSEPADDAASQTSQTTGLPSASVGSQDAWQRLTSTTSDETR